MRKPTSLIVVLFVLACVLSTYQWNVRAAVASHPAPTAAPVTAGVDRGQLSTRNADPRIGSLTTPEPTPLPTPVTPTDSWRGYIIPPPAPPPVAPLVVRSDGWPVRGPISQFFSPWHQGLDIAVPCGTPVAAIADGRVVWSAWKNNGGGMVVDVRLDSGRLASFNHLSLSFVAPGQRVVRGQAIAASGTSGNSTGCHLHLGIQDHGKWVDPLGYLAS